MRTPLLEVLSDITPAFVKPSKKINEGQDVSRFLQSKAYSDIMTFLLQLNRALFPCSVHEANAGNADQTRYNGSPNLRYSGAVIRLQGLLRSLNDFVAEAQPDTGPRRFGNMAYRKWYQVVEDRSPALLLETLPDIPAEAHVELSSYFLGSFGSAQRLDYGSGHELSFLAFLGCIWKLGGFPLLSTEEDEGRGIVLGVFQQYLDLIRRLIKTYTLEPAGSHGVWGLDDHSFLPYIFGSAQYGPSVSQEDQMPTEGSFEGAPDPADVVKAERSQRYKDKNMYFSAICFIHDVKKGPFWEHSPMLYDISGVRGGWGKINKGMIKMYNAEVIRKFPVVQHFRFGSLFSWDIDPDAPEPPASVHTANQPLEEIMGGSSTMEKATMRGPRTPQEGVKAPWASGAVHANSTGGITKAPWITNADAMSIESRAKPSPRIPPQQRKLRDPVADEVAVGEPGTMSSPAKAHWARPP